MTQLGVRLAVRDLAAHRRFYAGALGIPEASPGTFRAGTSVIIGEQRADARTDAQMQGPGGGTSRCRCSGSMRSTPT